MISLNLGNISSLKWSQNDLLQAHYVWLGKEEGKKLVLNSTALQVTSCQITSLTQYTIFQKKLKVFSGFLPFEIWTPAIV